MKRHARRREATPVAHMILSKRMADHKPHDMICELVDNVLDADAQRVWIELGRRSITVADDGIGMEDVNDAIRFGKGTRGDVVGRYGVGMTDALCKLGPKAEVKTLRGDGLRRLRVDWEECLRGRPLPLPSRGQAPPHPRDRARGRSLRRLRHPRAHPRPGAGGPPGEAPPAADGALHAGHLAGPRDLRASRVARAAGLVDGRGHGSGFVVARSSWRARSPSADGHFSASVCAQGEPALSVTTRSILQSRTWRRETSWLMDFFVLAVSRRR